MDLNTKVRRSASWAGVYLASYSLQGWGCSLVSAVRLGTAASIKSLVNSDSSSKDTIISVSRIVSLLIVPV